MECDMKLYETDYVIVDTKTKRPAEGYEIIYHYTSVIDIFNERLMKDGYEYISMADLSKEDKKKYKQTIKEMESFYEN